MLYRCVANMRLLRMCALLQQQPGADDPSGCLHRHISVSERAITPVATCATIATCSHIAVAAVKLRST